MRTDAVRCVCVWQGVSAGEEPGAAVASVQGAQRARVAGLALFWLSDAGV